MKHIELKMTDNNLELEFLFAFHIRLRDVAIEDEGFFNNCPKSMILYLEVVCGYYTIQNILWSYKSSHDLWCSRTNILDNV